MPYYTALAFQADRILSDVNNRSCVAVDFGAQLKAVAFHSFHSCLSPFLQKPASTEQFQVSLVIADCMQIIAAGLITPSDLITSLL